MAEATAWKPIIIDTFADGIGKSPTVGFGDMRNVNISAFPGEVTLGFKSDAVDTPANLSGVSVTGDATTDVFTSATAVIGLYNGTTIRFNSIGTMTGITTVINYYIFATGTNTFELYTNPDVGNPTFKVNLTASGTGTFSTIQYNGGLDSVTYMTNRNPLIFILDEAGKAWWLDGDRMVALGNTTVTGSSGRGIAVWKNYLIVFRQGFIDAFPIAQINNPSAAYSTSWTYGFQAISNPQTTRRAVLAGQDDILYFANTEQDLGSLEEVAAATFDPTNAATWIFDASALDIPTGSGILELGELGQYLLLGTAGRFIYPWDRVSPSFIDPLILPEYGTSRIETANALAFIFAGDQGNIYVTNGSTIELYQTIPDSVVGKLEPYFQWHDVTITNNQLYFSFNATTNAGVDVETTAGVWAIDIPTKVLRHVNKPSYGTYTGAIALVIPNILDDTPAGDAVYMSWEDNVFGNGVDNSSTALSNDYSTTFDSAFYTVGNFLTKRTFNRIDVILNQPLTATQGVQISYRYGYDDAFTLIGSFEGTDANYLNRYGFTTNANIQDATILQIRVAIKGDTYFSVKSVTLN